MPSRYAIDFGILPYLTNLPQFTYSLWVRRDASTTFAVLISHCVDEGTGRRGNFLLLNTNGDLQFDSYKTPNDGHWKADLALWPTYLVWQHVCLTYDNTTSAADPLLYVDGVPVAMTETGTPSGTTDDDGDCPLVLFNIPPNPATSDRYYYDTIHDVSIKDVRIYNRILNSDEIAELAAGENDWNTVQDGLKFCGPVAPIDNTADYIGDTIENDDWMLDIVHQAAGIPYNESSDPADMMHGEAI
jgi:hypothetical protein